MATCSAGWHTRPAEAWSRARSRAGSTFNYSRVGGNLAAAGLSNLYYESADRTAGATMSRWGTLIMWNALTNEMREFWPDLRAKLQKD